VRRADYRWYKAFTAKYYGDGCRLKMPIAKAIAGVQAAVDTVKKRGKELQPTYWRDIGYFEVRYTLPHYTEDAIIAIVQKMTVGGDNWLWPGGDWTSDKGAAEAQFMERAKHKGQKLSEPKIWDEVECISLIEVSSDYYGNVYTYHGTYRLRKNISEKKILYMRGRHVSKALEYFMRWGCEPAGTSAHEAMVEDVTDTEKRFYYAGERELIEAVQAALTDDTAKPGKWPMQATAWEARRFLLCFAAFLRERGSLHIKGFGVLYAWRVQVDVPSPFGPGVYRVWTPWGVVFRREKRLNLAFDLDGFIPDDDEEPNGDADGDEEGGEPEEEEGME
jgi:hypothetical protein